MKLKKLIAPAAIALMVVAASVLEYGSVRIEASTAAGKFLFLLFLNSNVAALLVLMFYVGKSLKGLYSERKRKVPGYRFKTKIALLFVVLVSIPTGLLFLTAIGLSSNYIERLFSPEFRRPVESSIEMAKALYDHERKRAIDAAQTALEGKIPPQGYKIVTMETEPADASGALKSAFRGERAAEVISGADKDIIRAAVPSPKGVLTAEYELPKEITASVKKINEAYEDYIKLESWVVPLKLNFLLILGFSTLMVVFIALWAALRVAAKITEPVKVLAEATEAVAAGDLNVSVTARSGDEMGLLMGSFNHMVREIREGRESLQAAYSESDRRRLCMENIVENIQSGVFSLDTAGDVIMINSTALRILGLKSGDVIGRNYEVILSGIESEELRKSIKEINLKTFTAAERQVSAALGGRRATLRISINGIRDSEGGYLGLLVVFDDLTNVIKAQRALAWQEVARRIAHEIKNPLTPIKLSTERMLKKWREGDGDFGTIFERSTAVIIKEVEGLRRLVDEFSRFGKMPEIAKKPTPVKDIVEEVTSLYKAYKGVNISLNGGDIVADLDGEQFKRVLINLFDNAIEAMGGEGEIAVSIASDPASNSMVIEVADTGPGIRDSDREKLFLPYFSTKKHGTGLGLAIAHKIISEHGGRIRVSENEPHRDKPRGSVFRIELPIKEVGANV